MDFFAEIITQNLLPLIIPMDTFGFVFTTRLPQLNLQPLGVARDKTATSTSVFILEPAAASFASIAISTYPAAYKTFAETRPVETIGFQSPRIYPPVL